MLQRQMSFELERFGHLIAFLAMTGAFYLVQLPTVSSAAAAVGVALVATDLAVSFAARAAVILSVRFITADVELVYWRMSVTADWTMTVVYAVALFVAPTGAFAWQVLVACLLGVHAAVFVHGALLLRLLRLQRVAPVSEVV